MSTISDITLYDLMADDIDVWVKKGKNGYDMEIEWHDDRETVSGERIHRFAMESFASFCRQYLSSYENASKENHIC